MKSDGTVKFAAKVKSKDDGDTYCVIVNILDHVQAKLWTSPKLCTPFLLPDEYATWIDNSASFRKDDYRFITSATREDYC